MVKSKTMISVLENKTPWPFEEIISVAQRDKNLKRKFLLVNQKQAKHLPVAPNAALEMFAALGELVGDVYEQKKVIVIGFAETATAIGTQVALSLGKDTVYLQTSRETIAAARNLLDFQEEHSHAVSQSLYCQKPQEWLSSAEVILFVEDEISTGKTILNLIDQLTQLPYLKKDVCFAVASLINGLDEQAMAKMSERQIQCHYLLKLIYDRELDPYPNLSSLSLHQSKEQDGDFLKRVTLSGKIDSRVGCPIEEYYNACLTFAKGILEYLPQFEAAQEVLVLGSEELMYPAILTAKMLQEKYHCLVKTHATTRSPIKVCQDKKDYPIFNGSTMESLYEQGRVTFLYNLKKYDSVVVINDADVLNEKGLGQLTNILRQFGNQEIFSIRWVI